MSCEKSVLRREIREKINSLDENYIYKSNAAIAERLMKLPEYGRAKGIFIYYSVGREPDTRIIIETALCEGKRVFLPRSLHGGAMEIREIYGIDGLRGDIWGIPAPGPEDPETDIKEIDFAVIPGMTFDDKCFRIGYGGGYYDRFLSVYRGFSVGLARELLMVFDIIREEFDMPTDCVISEERIIRRAQCF